MTNPLRVFAPPTGSVVAGRKGSEFGYLTARQSRAYALFRQIADFVNNLKEALIKCFLWALAGQEPQKTRIRRIYFSCKMSIFCDFPKMVFPFFGVELIKSRFNQRLLKLFHGFLSALRAATGRPLSLGLAVGKKRRKALFTLLSSQAIPLPMHTVTIYTDGSCLGNPGPGGFGAVLQCDGKEIELSGGFALTTNNRMEMMAAIVALESLKSPCSVSLLTDSQYLRNAVEKKWLDGWMKNGWKTAAKKPVKNQDLWMRLHAQLVQHQVKFAWVRGHAGHVENERCDVLARSESCKKSLPPDTGFNPSDA